MSSICSSVLVDARAPSIVDHEESSSSSAIMMITAEVTSPGVNSGRVVPIVDVLNCEDIFQQAKSLVPKAPITMNIYHAITAPCVLKASIFVSAEVSQLVSKSLLHRMALDFAGCYDDFHQVLDKGGTALQDVHKEFRSPTLHEVVPSVMQGATAISECSSMVLHGGEFLKVEHVCLGANYVISKGSNVCDFDNDLQAAIKDKVGTEVLVPELINDIGVFLNAEA